VNFCTMFEATDGTVDQSVSSVSSVPSMASSFQLPNALRYSAGIAPAVPSTFSSGMAA
jgi:hypothetical protein